MFKLSHSIDDGFTFSMKGRPLLFASDFDIAKAATAFIGVMNNALLTKEEEDKWNDFMNTAITAALIDEAQTI